MVERTGRESPAFAKAGVSELESALQRLKQSGIRNGRHRHAAGGHRYDLAHYLVCRSRGRPTRRARTISARWARPSISSSNKKALIFVVNGATGKGAHHRRGRGALSQMHVAP